MVRGICAVVVAALLCVACARGEADVAGGARGPGRVVDGATASASSVPLPRPAAARGPRAPVAEARTVVGLVPSVDAAVTDALAAGARRALDEARDAGGPDLALRVAETEARWGAVAAQAAALAFEDDALAIIAPPERERAHAIAQLGTRAQIPIVSTSPWASVMQAGSTWVTSVVPAAEAPAVDPQADWDRAGYDAARAVLEAARTHGPVRHRWR